MAIELRMRGAEAVVAKVRPGEDDARTRLEEERRLLRELDLAGTVTPLDDEVTDEPALLLEPAGTATLATSRPTSDDVRSIGAELAETVGALHEHGVTHGAVAADHVLWSPGRAPVLCGFGSATRDGAPDADAEALGRLLVSLAPDDPSIREAVEGSRGDLRRLRSALGATARGPKLPPTGPRPADRPAARPAAPVARWRPSRTVAIAGAIGLVVAVAAVALVLSGREQPFAAPPPTTSASTTPPPTPTTAAPTTTTAPRPEQVWPPPEDCPVVEVGADDHLGLTDIDADGCAEAVLRSGAELRVGDRRFELGTADDLVVLGDWSCDGQTTPALVTTATGAVHPFPAWPTDVPIDVEAVAVLGEVSAAAAVADGPCDVLVVDLADGTSQEVIW